MGDYLFTNPNLRPGDEPLVAFAPRISIILQALQHTLPHYSDPKDIREVIKSMGDYENIKGPSAFANFALYGRTVNFVVPWSKYMSREDVQFSAVSHVLFHESIHIGLDAEGGRAASSRIDKVSDQSLSTECSEG